MLLQLPALSEVPGSHGVVETPGPKLSAIMGYVDAASAVRVTLELPAEVGRRTKGFIGM